jgi:uncharacterized RDD family membrane protein YckC
MKSGKPSNNSNKEPPLEVEHAGVFRRVAALIYDVFLIAAIWFGITGVAVSINGGEALPQWANQFIIAPTLLLATFLFYYWFWTHGGQTLGMRAWRLKILNLEKKTPTLNQCIKRFFIALISVGIGFLVCLFNKQKMSLQDLASDTQIVLLPKEVY